MDSTIEILRQLIKDRIILLDGAMGTTLHSFNLSAQDFGGSEYEGCNEYLNLTRPELIKKVHDGYFEAGSDIVYTNSFAGSPTTLAEYNLQKKTYDINRAAAQIAKSSAKQYSTQSLPRFVAGSIGPTNKTISVTRNATYEELENSYYEQAKALADGGVDLFAVETVFDTLNAKAAMGALMRIFGESKKQWPIILSATIERSGTMLAGQDIEAFFTSMAHYPLLAIGMNCATGPDLMKDHIRTLSGICPLPIICKPNAGIPKEDGSFPLTPHNLAVEIVNFAKSGWVNMVGGCCGTTRVHIETLAKQIQKYKPRALPIVERTACAGVETLVLSEENRPAIVGERTNVIGSKKFKDLIVRNEFETAAEVGRAQVESGAQVLDICLANPDRNEKEDTTVFFDKITRLVRVPFMIDSTDANVIEVALRKTLGKCIINSINFEDGLERCEKVLPLVKKYGAAVIVGTIDEDKQEAMATTTDRKMAIALRAYSYLTKEWNIAPQDIIYDTLVFPIATGDEKYAQSAKVTLEAIERIKKEIPKTKTILGISNVSFGLPPAGREVLNSVFLYHATKAGLDYAIVNSEKLLRYPSISEEEKKLAEDLLFCKVPDPITPFVEFYRGKKVLRTDAKTLPLGERLSAYIIDGKKEGLIQDLAEALKSQKPLEIINGPLMRGMDEVGRLFNDNKLIVTEVLQSAEAMKAAVSYLEGFMEKSDETKKGKVMIATVKGDVHDIGKNLLEIILHNNGFDVINLGIKVAPETLIEAYKTHKPDVIGLSGLLVKSAQMMVTTAEDFHANAMKVPLMVGGAALSEQFTQNKIMPAYGQHIWYSKDAMHGLSIVKKILAGDRKPYTVINKKETRKKPDEKFQESAEKREESALPIIPLPPSDCSIHIVENYPLQKIFDRINSTHLYSALGLKGDYQQLIKDNNEKAIKLTKQVKDLEQEIIAKKMYTPKALYKYMGARRRENKIELYEKHKKIDEILLPSSPHPLLRNIATEQKGEDSIVLFVASCGEGIAEKTTALREKGEYLLSILIQVHSIACAESFADCVQEEIAKEWSNSTSPLSQTPLKHFRALPFGYTGCAGLEELEKVFKILEPNRLGIQLTESHMMEPEATVCALVLHPPIQEK